MVLKESCAVRGAHAKQRLDIRSASLSKIEVAGAVVVLFLLCLLFPYSGDDWTWAGQAALDRLSSGFENYNGRYAGNLLIILLSRFYILRSLMVCLFVVGIAWALYRLIGRDRRVFWLTLILLAFMPEGVRRQAIVWASGFTNYVVPTFLLLLYLIYIKGALEGNRPQREGLLAVSLFFLGFVESLFMENITLSNIAVALAALIYTRFKFGRWDICQIAFVVGSIFGAAAMFSNGAYLAILTHQDTYRSFGDAGSDGSGSGLTIDQKYLNVLAPGVALNNYAIAIALVAASSLAAVKAKKHGHFGTLNLCAVAAFGVFAAYFVYSSFFVEGKVSNLHLKVDGFVAALFIALLLAIACALWKRNDRMPLLVWGLIVSQFLPLFVVNPTGPRNFFPIYVLLAVFVVLYLHDTVDVDEKAPAFLLPALTLVVFIPWFVLYVPVAEASTQRSAIIVEALQYGSQEIVLPKVSNNLVHGGNPAEGSYQYSTFKEYYGIPSDVKIDFE